MKCSIVRLTFLTVTSLFFIGCAKGLEPFPADYIYVVKPTLQQCSKHKIISKDPVKVDKGVWVDWRDCPDVFGFESKDAGPVLNWIRYAQEEAKKRCQ